MRWLRTHFNRRSSCWRNSEPTNTNGSIHRARCSGIRPLLPCRGRSPRDCLGANRELNRIETTLALRYHPIEDDSYDRA